MAEITIHVVIYESRIAAFPYAGGSERAERYHAAGWDLEDRGKSLRSCTSHSTMNRRTGREIPRFLSTGEASG